WKKSHKNRLSLIPVFQKTKNQNCIFLTCGKSGSYIINFIINIFQLCFIMMLSVSRHRSGKEAKGAAPPEKPARCLK
ncbi:hypothetical protein, partial [Pseudobacillus badius]|uniref:hypothetical protein n=1 Tax=Bacillus badius TaxID=1455 RepID=UPI0019D496BA